MKCGSAILSDSSGAPAQGAPKEGLQGDRQATAPGKNMTGAKRRGEGQEGGLPQTVSEGSAQKKQRVTARLIGAGNVTAGSGESQQGGVTQAEREGPAQKKQRATARGGCAEIGAAGTEEDQEGVTLQRGKQRGTGSRDGTGWEAEREAERDGPAQTKGEVAAQGSENAGARAAGRGEGQQGKAQPVGREGMPGKVQKGREGGCAGMGREVVQRDPLLLRPEEHAVSGRACETAQGARVVTPPGIIEGEGQPEKGEAHAVSGHACDTAQGARVVTPAGEGQPEGGEGVRRGSRARKLSVRMQRD